MEHSVVFYKHSIELQTILLVSIKKKQNTKALCILVQDNYKDKRQKSTAFNI